MTDFGVGDWFVGTMKGVIKGVVPEAEIIDLSHNILPGDIKGGALTLLFSYRYFPESAVFCCVIDPGVGTEREAIVATDGKYFYTAPNNGLLGLVAEKTFGEWRCYKIENQKFMLPQLSDTFHGRDIFAPAAGYLAKGIPPAEFGKELKNFISLQLPPPEIKGNKLGGEIIYVDRFGNLITNVDAEKIASFRKGSEVELRIGRKLISGLRKTFAEVRKGEALMYIGSSGYLEIAINGGNAADELRAKVGTPFFLNKK